jgi:GT2 family glycosyltransferase
MMESDIKLYRETAGSGLPEASLLVCSRNRPRLLFETIQSILAADEIPTEIVIIDQSDIPNTNLVNFKSALACDIRYIWTDEKGVSRGRNRAIEMARYPLLVFIDDDIFVSPNWYSMIVRTLVKCGSRSAVTGKVLSSEENFSGYAPSLRDDEEVINYHGRINQDVLATVNMAVYCSAFEDVGYFDPLLGPGTLFPAAEDNDIGLRLLEAGYSIRYEPQAVVYHRDWRSEKEFLWLHWNYGRGQGAFYAKHFSLKDTYMLRRMVRDIVRFPYRILRRQSHIHRDALFVAGLLYGAARWLMMSPRSKA